jgi:hypothetical protein
VRLFNPRTDPWREHFAWEGPRLLGLTDVGKATIGLLQINSKTRVQLRQLLIEANLFPPGYADDLLE